MRYIADFIGHDLLTYGLIYSTFFYLSLTVRVVYRWTLSRGLARTKNHKTGRLRHTRPANFTRGKQLLGGDVSFPSGCGATLGTASAMIGLASLVDDDFTSIGSSYEPAFTATSSTGDDDLLDSATNPATGLSTIGGIGTMDIGGNAWGSSSGSFD